MKSLPAMDEQEYPCVRAAEFQKPKLCGCCGTIASATRNHRDHDA